MKYFKNIICGLNLEGTILPFGTSYANVSTAFLDGFINYFKPIKAYCLCNYHSWDEPLENGEGWEVRLNEVANLRHLQINRIDKPKSHPWGTYKFFKKQDLFDAITLPRAVFHLNLSDFRDDVLLLSQNENKPDEFIYFWYNLGGRCDIGRFKTKDTLEVVISEFERLITALDSDNLRKEIPLHTFAGWLSF